MSFGFPNPLGGPGTAGWDAHHHNVNFHDDLLRRDEQSQDPARSAPPASKPDPKPTPSWKRAELDARRKALRQDHRLLYEKASAFTTRHPLYAYWHGDYYVNALGFRKRNNRGAEHLRRFESRLATTDAQVIEVFKYRSEYHSLSMWLTGHGTLHTGLFPTGRNAPGWTNYPPATVPGAPGICIVVAAAQEATHLASSQLPIGWQKPDKPSEDDLSIATTLESTISALADDDNIWAN